MKFLIDAQLPAGLATLLDAAGHDAVHVSTMPLGNRTPDSEITRQADIEERTVVTKDRDFRDAHLLNGAPRSLLIVTTGNIQNRDLLASGFHGKSASVRVRNEEWCPDLG